jgi:CBS domain-containing protein
MRAFDVMVRDVVTVHPETEAAEAIKLLTEHGCQRSAGTRRKGRSCRHTQRSGLDPSRRDRHRKTAAWWVEVTGASTLATEFAKSHDAKVGEVMTTGVISVWEDAPLSEVAAVLERNRIKRVPVVKDGKLIGIVSRANLIQALASMVGGIDQHNETDRQIRLDLLSRLQEQTWTDFGSRNITVSGGVVHLWGLVDSRQSARRCLRWRKA